jgi:hypothetical protein
MHSTSETRLSHARARLVSLTHMRLDSTAPPPKRTPRLAIPAKYPLPHLSPPTVQIMESLDRTVLHHRNWKEGYSSPPPGNRHGAGGASQAPVLDGRAARAGGELCWWELPGAGRPAHNLRVRSPKWFSHRLPPVTHYQQSVRNDDARDTSHHAGFPGWWPSVTSHTFSFYLLGDDIRRMTNGREGYYFHPPGPQTQKSLFFLFSFFIFPFISKGLIIKINRPKYFLRNY